MNDLAPLALTATISNILASVEIESLSKLAEQATPTLLLITAVYFIGKQLLRTSDGRLKDLKESNASMQKSLTTLSHERSAMWQELIEIKSQVELCDRERAQLRKEVDSLKNAN